MNTHTQFIYVSDQIGFNTVQQTGSRFSKENWLRLLGGLPAVGQADGNGRINQPSTANLTPAHWLGLLSGSPQTGGSYTNGQNGNGTGPATPWEPVVFLTPDYWLRLLGGAR